MGNERAETYLRQLAEAGLRRVADQLRGLDDTGEPDQWPDPRVLASAVAESALWKVIRAGQILVAAARWMRITSTALRPIFIPPLRSGPGCGTGTAG